MQRLARMTGRILVSNLAELQTPYKLTYALTYRCQHHCSICGIWRTRHEDELSTKEIIRIFQQAPWLSWVHLSGGEVFLREDLVEIIRAIDVFCPNIYLLNFPTNGSTPDIAVAAVSEVVRTCSFPRIAVTVSLDGPPALHDRLRGTAGAWRLAVETFVRLRRIRNRRLQVFFGMTLHRDNISSFDDTIAAVRTVWPAVENKDFHINIAHISEHYYQNTGIHELYNKEKMIHHLEGVSARRQRRLLDLAGFIEKRYVHLAERYLRSDKTPVACQALAASCFMGPSGTVYSCSIDNNPVGNIREFGYDLRAIWNSEIRRVKRKEIRDGNCPQCWTPCEAYQSMAADFLLRWFKR